MQLCNSTWKQVENYFLRKDLVVLPVGSLENHGAHLCLGTDTRVPQHLVKLLEARMDAAFAPAMPFGCADQQADFPGTVSIGSDGLYLVISRVVQSLYQAGARHFVFLNGHGGNDDALKQVSVEMSARGGLCAILDWWVIARELDTGTHGPGEGTAAMLAIDPTCVHMELFRDDLPPTPIGRYDRGAQVLYNGVCVPVSSKASDYTPSSWGKPGQSSPDSAAHGREMLEATADFCADFIQKFERMPVL